MQSHKLAKHKDIKLSARGKLLALFIIVIIFLGSGFLARSWIRMTLLPEAITVLYKNSVRNTANDEINKLQDPIKLLSYTKLEAKYDLPCTTNLAKGFKTQVDCSYDLRAYRQIDLGPQSVARLNENATKLQTLLKQNGWDGTYIETAPTTSIKLLIKSITSGIDYQPDAAYQKTIGKVHCAIDSETAFSKSKPPAMATQISCSRTFNIFGTPTYDQPPMTD